MKTYEVVIERDSEAWLARVPSVPGCHTYGRTLQAARRRIHEALSLWVHDAARASLEVDVRLPRELRAAIQPVAGARRRAEAANDEAQARLVDAARTLTDAGVSLRDAGDLLGVSHQRVAQLLAG